MSIWDSVVGQSKAVEQLQQAVKDPKYLAHAWLITGPPGSGRSNAALAFAAALQCEFMGCGVCTNCRTTLALTHADVTLVKTDTLSISKEEVVKLVTLAQRAPALGKYRVLIMEDADRMSAGTFNVLLKAIEEPPPRTIWVLCVPGAQDLAPTIRSRCRVVNLKVPAPIEIEKLLIERDGIEPSLAKRAATAAFGHIGIAKRYALDPQSLTKREEQARQLLALTSVGQAVSYAGELYKSAADQAKEESEALFIKEKAQFMKNSGVELESKLPPQLRAQFRALEEQAKKRSTRLIRDVVNRYLLDIHSVLRDVLTLQLNSGSELINPALIKDLELRAKVYSAENTLELIELVGESRKRIEKHNVPPLLAIEALLSRLALS